MSTYIYEKLTGRLVSWNQGDNDQVAPADVLEEKGFARIDGLPMLDDTHQWHEGSQTVIEVEAPVKPEIVSTFDFLMSFSPEDMATIRASTDPVIQQTLFALQNSPEVDLNHPAVKTFTESLAQDGIAVAAVDALKVV